jgi:hypothetical protein
LFPYRFPTGFGKVGCGIKGLAFSLEGRMPLKGSNIILCRCNAI